MMPGRVVPRPGRGQDVWRSWLATMLLVGVALLGGAASARSQVVDTLWVEDFEGDWESRWADDFGTWAGGIPTSGPNQAHSGQRLVATVLDGDYAEGVDSKFYRIQSFVVPAASAHPRLRFWQWFSISTDDAGYVMIQPEGEAWQTLETYVRHSSNRWTRGFVDLTPFAGRTVKIAFHFHSAASFFCNPCVGPGWYIDDIALETGDRVLPSVESWETGFGGWYAEHAMWEVGVPTSGPGSAHSGVNVAATILDGNYFDDLESRLVSPPFTVPAADEYPRVRFWHAFNLSTDDVGRVEVRVAGGPWQTLDTYSRHSGDRWTRGFADLVDYAGTSVELAFHLVSASSFFCSPCVAAGWYIDDVTIETGPRPIANVTTWDDPDSSRAWYADRGIWEIGEPTSGPGSAYSGLYAAGTILDGNYFEDLDSRLISPPILVRPNVGNVPSLRFRNWFNFASDDAGYVQVRVGSGPWQTISGPYTGSSTAWGYPYLDLSAYTDSLIQVAFYFASRSSFFCNPCVNAGWYIDDVRLDEVVAWTPVLLAQQSATLDGDDVVVEWQTIVESEVAGYHVERSEGGGPRDVISPEIPARGGGTYSYRDRDVGPGRYVYHIVQLSYDGSSATVGVVEIDVRAEGGGTFLDPVEPNPFGARALLRFGLAEVGDAALAVYDIGGRCVRSLVEGVLRPGTYAHSWDGRDDRGRRLPSGVYYASLKTRAATLTRRVMLVE